MTELETNGHDVDPTLIQSGYEEIFRQFRSIYPAVPDQVISQFRTLTQPLVYKKNELLLDYGEICRKILFVLEGMVCSYLIFDGIEKPVWYIGASEITLAVESFYFQQVSKEKLVALEDTVCISLSWDNYHELCRTAPDFRIVEGQLFLQYLIQALLRIELLHCDPRTRYNYLVENRPDIIANASVSQLANYLGVARETLSRIRNEQTKGSRS